MSSVLERHDNPTLVRVLVAEDDELLRNALCKLLVEEGFDVVGEVADGQGAVSLALESRPDVVLMDYRMPGMDGLEAIGRIKEHQPSTQAVVFTAYDDESLNLEAERADVYCLLVKGCAPSLILTMVSKAGKYKRELDGRLR